MIEVSVIIVVRNEEDYILKCIKSIEEQFSSKDWELLVVDSLSEDATLKITKSYLGSVSYSYKILTNSRKILSTGWNIGIKNSRGKYIVRPDAHATLNTGYIDHGIKLLKQKKNIIAVGGRLETKSKSFIGSLIKEALSMKIGVGNSSFRTATKSGYYDTAVYALYRRDIFKKVGYFNEQLVRHQDNEMHQRISKYGGRFYLCNKMKADYYCRETIKAIALQMFLIGRYLPYVMHTNSLSIRHYVPFLFLISVFVLLYVSIYTGNLSYILLYLLFYIFIILVSVTAKIILKKKIKYIFLTLLIPVIHFSYGVGTFFGMLENSSKLYKLTKRSLPAFIDNIKNRFSVLYNIASIKIRNFIVRLR